jgi:hypothetical protein
MAHPGGRPLKYADISKLQQDIDNYFNKCDEGESLEVYDKKTESVKTIKKRIPYTITGLALALDTSRETLREYQERPEFVDTIKRAKERCENYAELRLMSGDMHPTGPIFALKNYGWVDKQEHTGKMQIVVTYEDKKAIPDDQS